MSEPHPRPIFEAMYDARGMYEGREFAVERCSWRNAVRFDDDPDTPVIVSMGWLRRHLYDALPEYVR